MKGSIWIKTKKIIVGGNFDDLNLTSADLALCANSNIKKLHEDKNIVIVEAKMRRDDQSNCTKDEGEENRILRRTVDKALKTSLKR